jgi:hypothetical protein
MKVWKLPTLRITYENALVITKPASWRFVSDSETELLHSKNKWFWKAEVGQSR